MAAWEDTLKGFGEQGKQIISDLKQASAGIKDDMSSFLQTEADRIKSYLAQRNAGDIDDDVLATLLRGERRFIQQHLDLIAAGVEQRAEAEITDVLLTIVVRLIKLL